jgi:hypothetical protein
LVDRVYRKNHGIQQHDAQTKADSADYRRTHYADGTKAHHRIAFCADAQNAQTKDLANKRQKHQRNGIAGEKSPDRGGLLGNHLPFRGR